MRERRPRTKALLGLLVGFACARSAFAQGEANPDAGPPPVTPTVDGGTAAPEAAPPPPPPDTGPGLFEQSVGAAAAKTEAAVAPPFTLNGYTRGDVFVGKVSGEPQGIMNGAYGELDTVLRTAKTPYGDGFAEIRLRYGLQGQTVGTFVDVREAYVNAYLGPVDLRLGKQIVVWGRADALNPTSNITPVDFRIRSPIEDDLRVGNVGARAFLRFAPFRLEGVWMPVYEPTELPTVGLPQFVSFGPPNFPTPLLGNGLGAGRLHLELPSVEMSVSYLYGYAPLPGLTRSSITFDPVNPSVVVSRTAYNQQVVGFDFSTAIGELMTVRGEAAYRRPFDWQDKPYAARPDAQYVLGADHNFGSLSVIAQYMGRYVFHWQKENGPTSTMDPNTVLRVMNPGQTTIDSAEEYVDQKLAQTNQILFSQTAQIQHLATLRLEWLLAHDTLSLSALGMLNVTTHEWLVTPRIGYKFTDAMTGYLGAQIFVGPTNTLFGIIENELSAVYGELRFAY